MEANYYHWPAISKYQILSLLKLAEYYQSKQLNIQHEDILITIGGSEGILFALMACLDEGDEIIVPECETVLAVHDI